MERTSPADDANQAQGATRAALPSRQAQLSPGVRDLHRVVLRAFLTNGRPPRESELRASAAELRLDADAAFAHLSEADLVHFDSSGHIAIAYPFSGSDRGIHIRQTGGPTVWAMCAIDALGIPQMSVGDVVIDAVDPNTQERISIDSHGGRFSWRPESTVVLLASNGCGHTSAESTCPLITFHTSERSALDHLNSQLGATGKVLSQAQATDLAGSLFASLLSEEPDQLTSAALDGARANDVL